MNETPIKELAKKPLTIEEFIARAKPQTKTIHIPELGGDVVIKAISAEERDEIQAASTDSRTGKTKEAVLVAVTIVKGLVEPKLTAANVEDLKKSAWPIVMKLSNEIWNISGNVEQIKND